MAPMSFKKIINGYWQHVAKKRKRQLYALVFLMVIASFSEVISLGAVLPFLEVLTQPDRVFSYSAAQPLLDFLDINTPKQLLGSFTLIFILAALFAGCARLLLLYVSTRLSFAMGMDFSQQVYRTTLYQPYAVHVARNSSEVISGATEKVNILIFQFLVPALLLVSNTIIFIIILLALLIVSPLISMGVLTGFGLIYGIVILVTRKQLGGFSEKIASESVKIIKVLQEGLGGIRDVIINNSQEVYCRQYKEADYALRTAQAGSAFIGGAPRFIAEPLGMVFIAALAFFIADRDTGLANAVALLGALAMGAQRLLPLMQQAYGASVYIRASKQSLQDVLGLLDQTTDQPAQLGRALSVAFCHAIELRNLGFRYSPQSPLVLSNINLKILRGSRVGFIGTTGSGKSTLLDLIMGLLTPSNGGIWIDGRLLDPALQWGWQQQIAHVPQTIYLSDASIAENIAFGLSVEEIDAGRVKQAAKLASIDDYIEGLPSKYNTLVGERGVRLSGGQRQRIGIARALYKEAKVIIFDEATSALDSETEKSVMDAIDRLDRNITVLIIAHRITTLQKCDQIVELKDGEVYCVRSYAELATSCIGAQNQLGKG